MLEGRVLILNQNYEPLSICSARKAVVLQVLGKVEVIESSDRTVRSVSECYILPSIVRLSRLIHVPRKRILLSRNNIIKRDNHRCQYCGTEKSPFTVDHIVPRDRGGLDTWENLVCACSLCNSRKRNRTPQEAGMQLLRKPRKPGYLFFIQTQAHIPDERWKPYLFMS
ncbi:MAG: HNH endonuclease [Rhodopseudomonas palustris]|nr:HNH endonuclease [Rhodopseudomonas palustris]